MYRDKRELLTMLSFGLALGADGNDYPELGLRNKPPKISDLQYSFVKKYNSLNQSKYKRQKRKRKIKAAKIARRINR